MSTADLDTTASIDPFRVLHVCTGNICRSPMAERLMREGLVRRLGAAPGDVLVESAGTASHAGAAMDPGATEALVAYGASGHDFCARALLREHVVAADLVLTATREHRAAVVRLHPRAAAKTFTLREFARLTAGVDPSSLAATSLADRGRALVGAARARRGHVPLRAADDDDVLDPYRGPAAGFVTSAELIQRSLHAPLDLLTGIAVASRP